MAVDSVLERPAASAPPDHELSIAARARIRGAELADARWAVPAAILALTLLSALLRVRELHFRYWVDEGISVGIASHPLSQLPELLKHDGSPPLYYAILHFWMRAFGRGEVATHALSLVCALIAVPVAYWAGASVFRRRVGLICAVLIALVPFLTQYAQETRMYALMLLISLVAAASFAQAFVRRRRRHLPVFAIATAAALYTHNWGLFLVIAAVGAVGVCVWCAQPGDRRGLLRDGTIAFGAIALLYLPWVPTVIYQAGHTGAPWALKPDLWSLTQGLYFIVGGRGAAVALLLGAGAGLLAVHRAAAPRSETRVAIYSVLALGLLTLLIAWAEAKVNPSWSPRYEAVIIGPLALICALGLAHGSRLGAVALTLVCCFWILDPAPTSVYYKSDVARAARAAAPHLGSDALVLSTQPEQVPTLAYYLPHVAHFGSPLGPISDPRVVNWEDALAHFRRSSVRSQLVPMLDGLSPGERVALVVPTRLPDVPLYMKLITRASSRWHHFLAHDPQLQLVSVADPRPGPSVLPVEIWVYRQRGAAGLGAAGGQRPGREISCAGCTWPR